MIKFFKQYIDRISLVVSCIAMMLMFLSPSPLISKVLLFATGLVGIGHLGYAAFLWFFKRVDFDWRLIDGHFLRKVIILVISMPSTITMIMTIISWCPCISTCSPESKELVFDNNLYKQNIEHQTNKIKTEETICINDSVFISNFSSYYTSDIDKTLPDSIKTKQEDPPVFWTVYYHFIDPGNQHMTTSKNGRGWSALIAILGVFLLNGLLVSSIVGWIDSRKEKWLKGEVKYRGFLHKYKHYVIIGGNDMTFGIVRQIMPNKGVMPYILIQTTRDVEEFRRELFSTLTEQQQQHIIIYYGSRTSETELMELCLQQAIEVYILGEQTRTDDFEPYHDTVNMQCFDLINQLLQGGNSFKEPIRCYVMFEYQTSFAAFQSSSQSRIIKTPDGKDLLSFIPFSPYENWAQTVLVNGNITIPDKTNITITYH